MGGVAARVKGLAIDAATAVIAIEAPMKAGLSAGMWWFNQHSAVNVAFWLGANHVGDHMEVARLAGADMDDEHGAWECEAHYLGSRRAMFTMQWGKASNAPSPLLEGATVSVTGSLDLASGTYTTGWNQPHIGEVEVAGTYPEHIRHDAWEKWSKATCTK